MFSSLFVCLSVSNFAQIPSKWICMKFSWKVGNGPMRPIVTDRVAWFVGRSVGVSH